MGEQDLGSTVRLVRWDGPISGDDPDANFKRDIALYSKLDPLSTFAALADTIGLPVGAVVHYALARWAAAGSEALLSVGPSVVEKMWATCVAAEESDTAEGRLEAYEAIRQMLSWLRVPLSDTTT